MLFVEEQKEILINKMTTFKLNQNTETFKLIRASITEYDIESLMKRNFLENIRHLSLSMNMI